MDLLKKKDLFLPTIKELFERFLFEGEFVSEMVVALIKDHQTDLKRQYPSIADEIKELENKIVFIGVSQLKENLNMGRVFIWPILAPKVYSFVEDIDFDRLPHQDMRETFSVEIDLGFSRICLKRKFRIYSDMAFPIKDEVEIV